MLSITSSPLFPFPSRPPTLDTTRRRPAPSPLHLGMAYQKRIPRSYCKFPSPIHPYGEHTAHHYAEYRGVQHCSGSIPTGKVVLTDSKERPVRRWASMANHEALETGSSTSSVSDTCSSTPSTVSNTKNTAATMTSSASFRPTALVRNVEPSL